MPHVRFRLPGGDPEIAGQGRHRRSVAVEQVDPGLGGRHRRPCPPTDAPVRILEQSRSLRIQGVNLLLALDRPRRQFKPGKLVLE